MGFLVFLSKGFNIVIVAKLFFSRQKYCYHRSLCHSLVLQEVRATGEKEKFLLLPSLPAVQECDATKASFIDW
jgi:hypothetical protein